MGTRYTKNIPKSVYFWKSGGYWAGPFVHPQKGRECVEYKLVPVTELDIKGEQLKKKIAEIEQKRPSVSQEELDKLTEWLKSDEGKRIIKEAQLRAEETCNIIDKMNDIDPKLLREPFNI